MPIVDGELVPEAPAGGDANIGTRSRCVKPGLGPRLPFLCFDCPVMLLALVGTIYAWAHGWHWRAVVLYVLEVATVSLLSIAPRREGYTYSGAQSVAGGGQRQMSVGDLPPQRSSGSS